MEEKTIKGDKKPNYVLTFFKDFGNTVMVVSGEMEWAVYSTPNKEWLIEKCEKLNKIAMINFNVERFHVW